MRIVRFRQGVPVELSTQDPPRDLPGLRSGLEERGSL
jgi:hypothetical protein